jgi:multiple antibiotic resistance protein
MAVIAFVVAITFLVFLAAGRIAKLLGITGNVLVSRLLGVLLAALAVQFVIDGLKAVWN